jgi:hypothetical protein
MTHADQLFEYIAARLGLIREGQTINLFDRSFYTFQTSAGQQVDKNLEYTEVPDILPEICFYTGRNITIVDDSVELGMEKHIQEFSVEGFIECDRAGTEGNNLRADISTTLRGDPWWDGLIQELQNIETDVVIENGDPVYAMVKFSASAVYIVPYGSE